MIQHTHMTTLHPCIVTTQYNTYTHTHIHDILYTLKSTNVIGIVNLPY